VAQGAAVDQEGVISMSEIADGAVLELSGRVVLLLHQAAAFSGRMADRHGLVGDSPALERIRCDISRVADLDVPVLLRGETGTGKELVARAIHDVGPRRNAPFLGINLGALAPSLAAAELFGAEKGSFTGSVRSQAGYFRAAQGGTLFLDEIGEALPEIQVMLLRALETGEVQAVGQPSGYRINARIVAATDSDLEARVEAGTFRRPLLYRLAGYEIWLPPLRERRDDIARLFFHFLRKELEGLGEGWRLESSERWVPPSLVARLVEYDWPGNVRQLRNLTRQLVIGSRGSARLDAGPYLDRLLGEAVPAAKSRGSVPGTASAGEPARRKPSAIGQDELREALRACRWDLQATARRLRISRPSLYLLIESSPGFRKAGDLRAEEIVACHRECGGDVEAMIDRLEVSRKALVRRLRELGL
jgi:two-component system nitrogen regulation response regulator GlnG